MNRGIGIKRKLGYGVGDLGGNLFFTLIGFYLPNYLTDGVMLSAGLAGVVVIIGSIWDAVTDPVVGCWSDRTVTRMGRRRPFMLWGGVSLMIMMVLMFAPWGITAPWVLFGVMTLTYCLLNTAYTLVSVPYSSLLPELTSDYDERTELTGYRMVFAVLGTLTGVGLAPWVRDMFGGNTETGWIGMASVMGGIMWITTWITVFSVREPAGKAHSQQSPFFQTMKETLSNRAFLLALFPWTFHIAGITFLQGSIIYYFKYIYRSEAQFSLALLALLLSALIFIPVWVHLSRKLGKKETYNLGMSLFGIGVLAFYIFGESGGVNLAIFLMALCGVGFSTHYVIPFALVPDVIECDYMDTGIRREGAYFSQWTFMSKIGRAIAMGLIPWTLALFGFVPDADQSAQALLGIKILCGPLPVACFLIGIVILNKYPITKAYYQKRLQEFESQRPVAH
ncbi:MAG: MFS transporter [Verrucomicrobia bacterium]|nr:MFS transporter [Verrucomicrobiota bacterium]